MKKKKNTEDKRSDENDSFKKRFISTAIVFFGVKAVLDLFTGFF